MYRIQRLHYKINQKKKLLIFKFLNHKYIEFYNNKILVYQ